MNATFVVTFFQAGIKNKPNYSAGDTLKRYTLEDEVQALKADLKVPHKEYKPIKLPKAAATNRNPGIFIEVISAYNI